MSCKPGGRSPLRHGGAVPRPEPSAIHVPMPVQASKPTRTVQGMGVASLDSLITAQLPQTV